MNPSVPTEGAQRWQGFGRQLLLVGALSCVPLLSGCRRDGLEPVRQIELSAAALNDYQGTYAADKMHKAFALSPDGAYAAAHTFPTPDLAAATALLNCNARVQVGQLECLVYDIDGLVVATTPLRMARK